MSDPTPEKAVKDALHQKIMEGARLREAMREAESQANRVRTEIGKVDEAAKKLHAALQALVSSTEELADYRRSVEKANR